MREREIQLHVMIDEDEFHQLDNISHKCGLSFSTVIRNLIMGHELRERPNADFLVLARSFDKIGANINQIARKANTEDVASADDLKEVKKLLREMRREMKDWKKTWQ